MTSISWIPSEAMTGPLRLPMDLGIGHYDTPPPERIEAGDLTSLCAADRFRFANHLSAWVEVDNGAIVDAGYDGEALLGSTVAKLGVAITIPGVSFPLLQSKPQIDGQSARFVQTAGGRTGAPLPRRIDRAPFIRMTSPTAWTTLALTITTDGSSSFELVGASPFPRHWIFDAGGALAAKSGLIDFEEWTRVHDHDRTPWHDYERSVLMADVESQIERDLSKVVMSTKPTMVKIKEGAKLIEQGQPGEAIYLILDGMLVVDVSGDPVAELGPGAIVGERAILETGKATATVTAKTPVRAARIPADVIDRSELERVAEGHRREEG
ncbi:MAG: cyclic nucleotide-binding domain-containing protein [Acidimicrobiia bacterium]